MYDRTARRAFIFSAVIVAGLAGCAAEDLYRKQPVRLAYEVGDKVAESRKQFQDLWNWYLGAIDPEAPTTEIEVCLTIAPDGKVIDSYIDSSTIRRKEFVAEVLKIYNGMTFAARDVPELTLCDEPLLFYALDEKPDPRRSRFHTAIMPDFEDFDEQDPGQASAPAAGSPAAGSPAEPAPPAEAPPPGEESAWIPLPDAGAKDPLR